MPEGESDGVGWKDDQHSARTSRYRECESLWCSTPLFAFNAQHQVSAQNNRDQRLKAPPNVVYAHLKFMWASGAQENSLNFLRQFSANLARDLQSEDGHSHPYVARERKSQLSKLLARCYFKQGQWQMRSFDRWVEVSFIELPVILY